MTERLFWIAIVTLGVFSLVRFFVGLYQRRAR